MAMDPRTARDTAVLWHPCTQMHDHVAEVPLLHVASASGAWLVDQAGRRYLDAISSWWTCLFGHCHPAIVSALKAQLDTLDHVLLAGCSHEPAVRLAEVLVAHAPAGLTRVFYADNGSAATEVALKMSLHYWRNVGEPQRQRLVALHNSYHGETIGALSVSDVGLYRAPYAPLLFEPLLVPPPDRFLKPPELSESEHVQQCLAALAEVLELHSGTVAALILEPLVQCAGGMRMYPASYLAGVRRLCDAHRVHLIADEIAVGMGRTGTLWACQQAGISPDFLLTSKALTGGTLPLAAVLTTESVYAAFFAEWRQQRAFLHSHSYTGNPLACSAALATFGLLDAPGFPDLRARHIAGLARLLAPFSDHPQVGEVRQAGMIGAIEIVADRSRRISYPAGQRRGLRARLQALRAGVLLRPLGDVLYLMLPYCLEDAEFEQLGRAIGQALEHAVAG